jgi:hypothetical protein
VDEVITRVFACVIPDKKGIYDGTNNR